MRDWKKEIQEVHPNLVPLEDIKNGETKFMARCSIDGYEWGYRAYDLLRGHGCHRCNKQERYTTESFKENLKSKGSVFEVLGEYTKSTNKILVKCNNCKTEYEKKAYTLIQGTGCIKCTLVNKPIKSKEVFAKQFNDKYKGEFLFVGEYTGVKEDVHIKHVSCGEVFKRSANHVLQRSCHCDKCSNSSSGELIVERILNDMGIDYEKEKNFKDLASPGKGNKLRFDFYIKDKSICIEYDGIQHFKAIEFFGGEKGLKSNKERDLRKNKYCQEKGIHLLRIPYSEKDIEGMIKRFIEKVSVQHV